MGLTKDKQPCGFSDPEYWVRGIADLLIIDGDTAFIVDYKTGKTNYADPKQLKLMALMTFAHFPEVEIAKTGLMFVSYDTFMTEEYKRTDSESLWNAFNEDLQRLSIAFDNAIWPAQPTGLCRKHCPVETCRYYGG
jgi:RecB family exonuclease